ncbi:hypothetical protein D9C73_028333 [Collichthys lucidus]|uniref:Uncharacterized protein n=1 Tax=Collichthys lucidus TaxID=240159 RepID=A0A4U5TWS3_COLLU|nr:hypothetical protein D9C73_028333 [Collichthys lucidus]
MSSQRFYQSYHDFPRFYQSRNHDFTEVLPEPSGRSTDVDHSEGMTPHHGLDDTEDAGTAVTDSIEEEERLQEERLEAARIAEEVARKAAEEAVRQLEAEHSAKIVIETLPESNEQLPNILEEENEDDPECAPDLCPPKEPDTPSSTAVEPASEKRDLESPVTQPRATSPSSPDHDPRRGESSSPALDNSGLLPRQREQQKEVEVEVEVEVKVEVEVEVEVELDRVDVLLDSCCHLVFDPRPVPDICSPIMSFLLRFPHAVECLESCRTLMHEHYLTPLKLSTPALPPELTQLKEELSQLPTQARHCCMSIIGRFRRLNSNSQHPEQP